MHAGAGATPLSHVGCSAAGCSETTQSGWLTVTTRPPPLALDSLNFSPVGFSMSTEMGFPAADTDRRPRRATATTPRRCCGSEPPKKAPRRACQGR